MWMPKNPVVIGDKKKRSKKKRLKKKISGGVNVANQTRGQGNLWIRITKSLAPQPRRSVPSSQYNKTFFHFQ